MIKTKKWILFFFFFLIWILIFSSCGNRGEILDSQGLSLAGGTISNEKIEDAVGAGLDQSTGTEEGVKQSTGKTNKIYVYICGAVNSPGVYEFAEGDRIYQAIDMAGGMKDSAAKEDLNLADLLTDGMQIRVYTQAEMIALKEAEVAGAAASGVDSQGRVNLNTASKEQLMTLPGVGESKANSIISFREENGNFQSIEDVMQITGIKEGVFNKFKDSICVN